MQTAPVALKPKVCTTDCCLWYVCARDVKENLEIMHSACQKVCENALATIGVYASEPSNYALVQRVVLLRLVVLPAAFVRALAYIIDRKFCFGADACCEYLPSLSQGHRETAACFE